MALNSLELQDIQYRDSQYWVSRWGLNSIELQDIQGTGSADGPWILSNFYIFSTWSADGPWILSNFRIFSIGSADGPCILTSGYSVLSEQMGLDSLKRQDFQLRGQQKAMNFLRLSFNSVLCQQKSSGFSQVYGNFLSTRDIRRNLSALNRFRISAEGSWIFAL